MYTCPLCGNSKVNSIGYKNGVPYCRLCLEFNGDLAEVKKYKSHSVLLSLDYPLSSEQEDLSTKLISSYIRHQSGLIHAVCGAGKTELVYGIIKKALESGFQVGFTTPRKDVIIDLEPRFKSAFPHESIISVYGGKTTVLEAQLLLVTTHQLYRYPRYFDLLIIDEADAFPFEGNELLNKYFDEALKAQGVFYMLSATPTPSMIDRVKSNNGVTLSLMTRFHHHPLIVPRIEKSIISLYIPLLKNLKRFIKEEKPVFVFVPTITLGEEVYRIVKLFCPNGRFVASTSKDRATIIQEFKEHKYHYLITTAILERGVTLKNLQVIIYNADNDIYDSKSLVQISGRVGRKIDAPDGEVIYLITNKTDAIEESIQKIEEANHALL